MFPASSTQAAPTINFMSFPGFVYPHSAFSATQCPPAYEAPPAPPAPSEVTMTDMMTVLGGLYSLVSTLSQESVALRHQVCQLQGEVASLRTENDGIISHAMAQANMERQVVTEAMSRYNSQLEDSRREVNLVHQKVVALSTIVDKTATTVDAVHSCTQTLPGFMEEWRDFYADT